MFSSDEKKSPQSWTEEVYGRPAFRPEENQQEAAVDAQTLSIDVGAADWDDSPSSPSTSEGDRNGAVKGGEEGESPSSSSALPQVTRQQVFTACLGTSGVFVLLAGFLRSYASLHGGPEDLLTDQEGLGLQSAAFVLGASLVVTTTRVGLLGLSEDFAEATNRSNAQILGPLKPYDYLWLCFLTGVSEEALFRGSLLPATTFGDWRGVLISAAIFGYFHRSGGRNWVFALWSTWVGTVYGGAFLLSKNLAVPMVAHALSNLTSAVIWKNKKGEKE